MSWARRATVPLWLCGALACGGPQTAPEVTATPDTVEETREVEAALAAPTAEELAAAASARARANFEEASSLYGQRTKRVASACTLTHSAGSGGTAAAWKQVAVTSLQRSLESMLSYWQRTKRVALVCTLTHSAGRGGPAAAWRQVAVTLLQRSLEAMLSYRQRTKSVALVCTLTHSAERSRERGIKGPAIRPNAVTPVGVRLASALCWRTPSLW